MRSADEIESEKRLAAEAAAALVEDGMRVGLGTGSTVAYLLPALAARHLNVVCVATSIATETLGLGLGLELEPFDRLDRLDIAIDGADQVAADFWLVKGGGGAHTREKIVAAATDRFVVIVSGDKIVEALAAPVPLELLRFGLRATLRNLSRLGECRLRDAPLTPDGGVLADYFGEVGEPGPLASRLASTPGVLGHGLFPPELVHDVVVARGAAVEHLRRV
ncbi:MAG TPA: ribose 5-phosphate isomerase A [Acidimicrobiales bacterium]|nr:ribose 5-phosphate isomerase A [Acidimicrobiales bacterium]